MSTSGKMLSSSPKIKVSFASGTLVPDLFTTKTLQPSGLSIGTNADPIPPEPITATVRPKTPTTSASCGAQLVARAKVTSRWAQARINARACSATCCPYTPPALVITRSRSKKPAFTQRSTPASGICNHSTPGGITPTKGAGSRPNHITPWASPIDSTTVHPLLETADTNSGSGSGPI